MRYLTLIEALVIAEASTGIPARTLAKASRLDALDSAPHAPQAEYGGVEFYPEFVDKAAVLAVRLARNHPLPDGNKRLAWLALNMFCELNDHALSATVDDAVETMLAVAAGDMIEADLAKWIDARLDR